MRYNDYSLVDDLLESVLDLLVKPQGLNQALHVGVLDPVGQNLLHGLLVLFSDEIVVITQPGEGLEDNLKFLLILLASDEEVRLVLEELDQHLVLAGGLFRVVFEREEANPVGEELLQLGLLALLEHQVGDRLDDLSNRGLAVVLGGLESGFVVVL